MISVAMAWLIADLQAAVGHFSDLAGWADPVKKSAVLASPALPLRIYS